MAVRYTIVIASDVKGADQAKEAIEDVQELADKGIEDLKIRGDDKALEELENVLKEIEHIATRPKKMRLDNKQAVKDARELERRIESIRKASDRRALPLFQRLTSDLREIRSEVPAVGKLFDLFGLAARGPVALLVGAVAALGLGWKAATSSFRAYLEESRKLAAFDARLAQQGALTDANRKKFIELANQLQKTTAIADDQWVETLGKLVQYGANPASIGMDVETVKNLAALLNGDLTQATRLYTLALQGNFGSLAELGIVIDQTASKTEKLAQLQRFAAEKGAGILEAQAAGAAGSVAQLGNEIGDTAEAFGRFIANTGLAQGTIEIFRGGLAAIRSILPETTETLAGLTNRLAPLREELSRTAAAAADLADEKMAAISASAQSAQRELDIVIKKLREAEKLALALNDSDLAIELAKINLAEQRKELTPEQANLKRFEARENAANNELNIRETRITGEIAAKQANLENFSKAFIDSDKTLAQLEATLAELKSRTSGFEKTDDILLESEKEIQSRIDKLSAAIEQLENNPPYDREQRQLDTRRLIELRGQRSTEEARLKAVSTERTDLRADPSFRQASEAQKKTSEELATALLVRQKLEEEIATASRDSSEEIRALVFELNSLKQVSKREQTLSVVNREIEKVGEQPAQEKGNNIAESNALADLVSRLVAGTVVRRNQGANPESDSQFRARSARVENLRTEALAAAQELRDGSDAGELEQLEPAIRELIDAVRIGNERYGNTATLEAMQRDISRLATQLRNLR